MAIAFEIIYTVVDEDGDDATTTIKVPTTFSLAQYTEFGAALATLMNNIIEGAITGADLCLAADVSGLTTNLTSGADDVEDIGAFQFATGDGRPVKVNVPGLDETKVAVGTDDINQVDVDVAAFIAAMNNGLTVPGGTIQPTDVGEDDITNLTYARERFRASGKRS